MKTKKQIKRYMIHFMISSYDMLSVSNVRRNSFVLLDNIVEKSKKQKADYPRYHFVKAAKHFV